MIDYFTTQVSFLLFEALFCFLSALVYSFSKDPLRTRKSIVLSLNVACGAMLVCEFLFYVYNGSTTPVDVAIMHIVNAAVYYLIVLLLLFYAMLVSVRILGRFDLKKDMPCRGRILAVCIIVFLGMALVTVSQFTGIYYSFDADNIYQRGPLFWLAALLPTVGAIFVASIIFEHKHKTNLNQRLVLMSYLVLPLIGEAVQILFFGNSLMNMCIGFSVLLMFFENMVNKEKDIIKASKTEIRTGLANEHGYIEWLRAMKGKPELKDYAAVFFDLRKFSDINRKFGIENGNRILAAFGNIMLNRIESDEILGRQFGNQFVAIVKKQNLDALLSVLKDVEVTFQDISTGHEEKVRLTARVGVYMIDRTDLDGEDILVFAGQALNAAKSREQGDVVWLTQELIDSISARKKLESDIAVGLRTGEFLPYYQPKVSLRTGKLCGAEALCRWMHDGNLVSPGKFIPIMEENDTICLLDFAILKATCEDIAKWLENGLSVPTISVNFSRRNLVDPELAKHIDEVVTSSGIPKDRIEIEVTESLDEFSIGVLKNFVDALHELGYKVSIDDFGSASSSLSLLREISFDTLKIDKGFVDHVRTKEDKEFTILTHIVRLARELNMRIVAEGVEKEEQLVILGNLGVGRIQGFYFDKPLPKAEMTSRLISPEYTVPETAGKGAQEAAGAAATGAGAAALFEQKENNAVAAATGDAAAAGSDFTAFVSAFRQLACVIAVDLKKQGSDRFLVVDANDEYKRTVVKDLADFETNVPYTRYIPQASNFEDLCESCALSNKHIHTYFDIELYNAWMEVFMTPLASPDPDRKLLLFSYEMNPKADINKLADISPETATNVIKTCLKLRETSDFQKAMNAVIADIRQQCAAKRCSILLTDFEKRQYSLLSEDYGNDPEQQPLAAYLTEDFYRVIETWPRLIKKSNCFIMTNESDMEEAHKIAPEWIDSLRGDNVRTLVIYPLRSDNKTIGYIWAGNFDPEKAMMIKETLGLTAFILSAEIANEQNIRKMKMMSITDLLTGVYNRNAMNNRITSDVNGDDVISKPFGVFFIDVNGLKTTNDTKGHLAGDALLKDVASTLKELEAEVCGEAVSSDAAGKDEAALEIYRVGGDEFMIIAVNTPKALFDTVESTLLSRAERPERAHFAVGACHSDEIDDIRKAMQRADARMYEVKEEYYSRHPEYEWHQKPV